MWWWWWWFSIPYFRPHHADQISVDNPVFHRTHRRKSPGSLQERVTHFSFLRWAGLVWPGPWCVNETASRTQCLESWRPQPNKPRKWSARVTRTPRRWSMTCELRFVTVAMVTNTMIGCWSTITCLFPVSFAWRFTLNVPCEQSLFCLGRRGSPRRVHWMGLYVLLWFAGGADHGENRWTGEQDG